MRKWLWIAFLLAMPLGLQAQVAGYDFHDFAAEYLDDENAEYYETLEELALHPIDLNSATKPDLLQLPFISEQQADAILAYRNKHHRFASIGELQFIPELSHSDRLHLSVFTVCRPPAIGKPTFRDNWLSGQHELSVHADIPFYKREGFRNNAYNGATIGHQLRYRYQHENRTHYGLTLKNDPGEPFAKRGNYPYDALMFYVHHRSRNDQWEWLAGDYRVGIGQGLAFGQNRYNSKQTLLDAAQTGADVFKPYTSASQDGFFRGAALAYRWKGLQVAAMASFRRLDARLDNDTARTLLTTGYHRTDAELAQRRNLHNLTAAIHVAYVHAIGSLSLTSYYSHYNHYIAPTPRVYNAHYLRGKSAAGLSLAYSLNLHNLTISGEAAADKHFNLAIVNRIDWKPFNALSLILQHRSLAAAYVAPYARVTQSNSQPQNEHGVYLGVKYAFRRHWELSAYADWAHFPQPTFYASQTATAWQFYAQAKYTYNRQNSVLLRYTGKAQQRDVTGYDGLIEYAQTHRLRLQLNQVIGRFDIHPAFDASFTGSQTTDHRMGYMASLRANYTPLDCLKIGAYGAFFHTDDYATRLYSYEPSLRYGSANQAFYYHGLRAAATLQYKLNRHIALAAKVGYLHYFNRRQISSGNQLIDANHKTDLQLEVVWRP